MKRRKLIVRLGLGIFIAILLGLLFAIGLLIRQRVVNANFRDAMLADDLPNARELLEKGADPNYSPMDDGWLEDELFSSNTYLHMMELSICTGNVEAVKLLLEYGVDVDSVGVNPNLELAALYGWPSVVEVLLDRGADPCYPPNYRNNAALHMAAYTGSDCICQLLLDAGANPEAQNYFCSTPLHVAAITGQPYKVEGYRVNFDNWDPGNQHAEVIRLLLEAGADPTIRDNDGRTPADTALENGRIDLHELLIRAEGDWLSSETAPAEAGQP